MSKHKFSRHQLTLFLAEVVENGGLEVHRSRWPLADALERAGKIALGTPHGPSREWRRAELCELDGDLFVYQFKSIDGGEIEHHSVMTLCQRAEKLGMSEAEVQRVILGEPDDVIVIHDVGDFRRTR